MSINHDFKRNFDHPDEVRKFAKGKVEIVQINGLTVGRGSFEPGWKWSECVKPIAETNSCLAAHTGYVLAGKMQVCFDDGRNVEFGPGDVMVLPPGHDAWVIGNEVCVVLDFSGMENYAKSDSL